MKTRWYVFALVAVLIAALALPVLAAAQKDSAPKTITLELSDVTVVEAFQKIFKGTSVSYIIQPGVSGTISSLNLKDVPFDNALSSLAKAAGLEVSKEDGIYVIGKGVAKSDNAQVSVVSKTVNDQQQQNYQAGQFPQVYPEDESLQNVVLGQYQQPAPYPQYQAPVPSLGEPVYYGHYPVAQGYYNPYNQYNQGYNQRPIYVSPPPYQLYNRPNLLPPPGVAWSAGIGQVDIVTPEKK